MNGILWFSMLVGLSAAWLDDTRFTAVENKATTVAADANFDDYDSMKTCSTSRYQMIGCYCALGKWDKEDNRWCDGNWIMWNEQTGDLECHSYTNADTEGSIRTIAICQQTVVYPMEPPKSTRLGPNPTVTCPSGYKMMDCWIHADVMDTEHWQNKATLTKDLSGNSCSLTNCVKCRIQASCVIENVGALPSLDTFPYPPEAS